MEPKRPKNKRTEFQKIMVNSNNEWYGILSWGAREKVTHAFIQRNFTQELIDDCMRKPNQTFRVVIAAPKNHVLPLRYHCTMILVYQQLFHLTCVLSSAASAFRYFNDDLAHNILRDNILHSEKEVDRFNFVASLLRNNKLLYSVRKFGYNKLSIFKHISCYPTIINLEGFDGSTNHAIAVVGLWIFDSNAQYAQRLLLPVLDWCCSTDSAYTKFHAVKSAMHFFNSKPRKEWRVCDGCRSQKSPCLFSDATNCKDD